MPAELFIAISIRTARSLPAEISTRSIAAAEIAWMPICPDSTGSRERPWAMSSASATRTTPASTVYGSPRRRWPMIACSDSAITTVRSAGSR